MKPTVIRAGILRRTLHRNGGFFGRGASPLLLAIAFSVGVPLTRSATPQWQRHQADFESTANYTNPVQQAKLTVTFRSPSGQSLVVPGFWDGANKWRVRFAPTQPGKWSYETVCSDASNRGLHQKKGEFDCAAPSGDGLFQKHGALEVADDGHHLVHKDKTAFFFLADTAWNGPLLSTDPDWTTYLEVRKGQKFDAVQWVTTQWRASPGGDIEGRKAYGGQKVIEINPEFFQRLDKKVEAMTKAGLASVPVLLWAIDGGSDPSVNPGVSLPEDQAILLARYMVARWGGDPVIWILGGDGDYRGEKAEKWKRIGRGVFSDIAHAPVTMHPGGRHWVWKEFKEEKWCDIVGYQSGHGDDEPTLGWMLEGPSTIDWPKFPHRPFINLEPPYENHIAYQSKKPISPETVRRAVYWSLLNVPPAGVSYGGHGVWGWDDGTKAPTDHAGTGTPLPWKEALKMPGAEQMKHVFDFFTGIEYWRLRPASVVVVDQPGKTNINRFVVAARTDIKDILVVYTPEDRTLTIKLDALPPSPSVTWVNPRTGEKSPAVAVVTANTVQFPTPAEGDWILFMETQKEKDKDAKPATVNEAKPPVAKDAKPAVKDAKPAPK